jgi:hypothetical protein
MRVWLIFLLLMVIAGELLLISYVLLVISHRLDTILHRAEKKADHPMIVLVLADVMTGVIA